MLALHLNVAFAIAVLYIVTKHTKMTFTFTIQLAENFLDIVDNILDVDQEILQESQETANTSAM